MTDNKQQTAAPTEQEWRDAVKAMEKPDLGDFSAFLDRLENVDQPLLYSQKRNLLMTAASAGNEKAVDILLARGARADCVIDGWTPLVWLVSKESLNENSSRIAQKLIDHGANPCAPCDPGDTPLHVVVSRHQFTFSGQQNCPRAFQRDVIHVLLKAGADPDDVPSSAGWTPRMLAQEVHKRPDIVELFDEFSVSRAREAPYKGLTHSVSVDPLPVIRKKSLKQAMEERAAAPSTQEVAEETLAKAEISSAVKPKPPGILGDPVFLKIMRASIDDTAFKIDLQKTFAEADAEGRLPGFAYKSVGSYKQIMEGFNKGSGTDFKKHIHLTMNSINKNPPVVELLKELTDLKNMQDVRDADEKRKDQDRQRQIGLTNMMR